MKESAINLNAIIDLLTVINNTKNVEQEKVEARAGDTY